MALRDQPYLPLYIQDLLTDEKLIECSAQAHGVYLRLMCIMHKSEQYGIILLKQKDQQTGSMMKDFAVKLAKAMPFSIEVIEAALSELILEKVITLNKETSALIQKRMVKDNDLSEKRALAGQKSQQKQKVVKGFAQANDTAKQPANTESEIEYDTEVVIEEKLKESLDEIYLDQQRIKWPHLDFAFEYQTFCEKVRGSPGHYRNHDNGGIRLAFQKQLRDSKNNKNGNGYTKSGIGSTGLTEQGLRERARKYTND